MGLRSLAVIFILAGLSAERIAWGRSADMKKPCVNCHTMHNSQGSNINVSGIGVQGALLNNSCYGCHSDAVTHLDTPVVLHITSAVYDLAGTDPQRNTLAGGDFHWMASGTADLKGHNVAGIDPNSQLPRTPPGGDTSFNSLTCAGTTGCHGIKTMTGDISAMYLTHHAAAPQPATQERDGTSLAKSYRWLNGIAGYEDPDYELTVWSNDHNQYKGISRSSENQSVASSISSLCAGCHQFFHNGDGGLGVVADGASWASDPWIRHPVDYNMGLAGEFAYYGGTSNSYNFATPVGSVDVSNVKSTVTGTDDTVIVCVTCHRAHGSPYDYSLRWDYNNWPGGANSYNGCGDCHTTMN